jgi:hypothetical protein
MGLIEKHTLIRRLSPPLDALLVGQLLDEFISLERRFVLRDWEPAELDGGQFGEVLARIIYHTDSAQLNHAKKFDDCLKYVEDPTNANTHQISPRHTALHIARVLRTVYNFRSQRGAVHISPTYTANHMDAKLMIECVRWSLNETLRLFLQADREEVAKVIRELLQFDVPCVGRFEDALLVQRTDLTAEEEILVLLHYAGDGGFSRNEIGHYARCSPSAVTVNLRKLTSAQKRQVIVLNNGNYRLTDLGAKRIREDFAEKLLLS